MRRLVLAACCSAALLAAPLLVSAQATPPAGGAGGQGPGAPAAAARRAPRPYDQVITARAASDVGMITVHKVEERWFLEVPDSLAGRDFLLVGRIAGVPAGIGGFLSAGTSVSERLVRFERVGERVVLRAIPTDAYAPATSAISLSVQQNNVGPVLAAFPAQAYTGDSASVVVDVTDFFAGDTPALSGLDAAARRNYQVRRLDPARSSLDVIRSYPMNVEVHHTQTFDAGAPPGDGDAATITLQMRQSLVLLPKEPMRPRVADARVGFFTVDRVNYALDEQKAATETFIRRWRLEPKDPAAYARGELVEPVRPIVYYLDPATPAQWRPYVRAGIEDWQRVFERAGFKNAIVAMDPPPKSVDPEWDAEDIRYSVVRWAASTVRNAVGPSTSDPRTGEIIESDITWYHNHMRSYRNRLMIETGAANPAARSLMIPEEVMGETMRQVITHEVGHALGLPHNMIASASFPTDSLRSKSFTNRYGVSATIMDYARQNYVAQPGDGLEPKDFIRRLGPFDEFVIEWGYRVFPDAATPEAERPTLDRMLKESTGMFAYRYLPQGLVGTDPRAQTEDLGDDPVRSSGYALQNLRRVVPQLVAWTSRPGEPYDDLAEIHGELIGMWGTYMGHVTNLVGGMIVDAKVSDQAGPVWQVVPVARQRAALRFLASNVFVTPGWLLPAEILSLTGPTMPSATLAARQATVVTALTDPRRLDRMELASRLGPGVGYDAATYLGELTAALVVTGTPDANRRALHRVYVERLEALLDPPPATGQAGFAGPALDVRRTDLSALARAQLVAIRATGRSASTAVITPVARAHWQDLVARVDQALEPR